MRTGDSPNLANTLGSTPLASRIKTFKSGREDLMAG